MTDELARAIPYALKKDRPRIGVLSTWSSRLGGGVFEAIVEQCNIIERCGLEPIVFALEDGFTFQDVGRLGKAGLVASKRLGPSVPGFSPHLLKNILSADLDVLHLNGIWLYPSHAGAKWAAITRKPYLISPHGMLDPWITSRSKTKKLIAKFGYEKRSWQRATAFHALTTEEASNILEYTGQDRIAVIPNSVSSKPPCEIRERSGQFLYIGRIHPKKNYRAMISGWRMVQASNSSRNSELVIAGWGDPIHVKELEQIISESGQVGVRYVGPVYGKEKAELLEGSDFVLLPSLSEGLPMVILEAWSSGTPVLMSSYCNLPEGFACEAALDSGISAESISSAIKEALALDSKRYTRMVASAQALAVERFSPEAVQTRWANLYRDLLVRGTRVRLTEDSNTA